MKKEKEDKQENLSSFILKIIGKKGRRKRDRKVFLAGEAGGVIVHRSLWNHYKDKRQFRVRAEII